jgi:hypothetical protein
MLSPNDVAAARLAGKRQEFAVADSFCQRAKPSLCAFGAA